MATRDLSARLRDRLTVVRRAVLRRRRLLAVLCVAGAAAAGLRATAPPAPPSAEVLVSARDLPAGAELRTDDLTVVELDPDTAPQGVLTEVDEAAGAILAAPLRAGEPLTDVRLVGPGLAATAPGTVAVPVRLSDAAQVDLLRVGDEVDLLATDPESRSTVTIASGALVLAVPDPGSETSDAITGRLAVLGIPDSTVGSVTGAAVTSFVTFAWTNR